jgi:hypothetical protein
VVHDLEEDRARHGAGAGGEGVGVLHMDAVMGEGGTGGENRGGGEGGDAEHE